MRHPQEETGAPHIILVASLCAQFLGETFPSPILPASSAARGIPIPMGSRSMGGHPNNAGVLQDETTLIEEFAELVSSTGTNPHSVTWPQTLSCNVPVKKQNPLCS